MVSVEVPETPLPAPGDAMSPEDHIQMSRRFVEHTAIERAKENRLQTSEKIWGSVAHAIIAVGKRRGWVVGDTHGRLQDVAIQLGAELDEADNKRKRRGRSRQPSKQGEFYDRLNSAAMMHSNFYWNRDKWDAIDLAMMKTSVFVEELESLLDREPTAFTPRNSADQERLAQLRGVAPEGTRDERTEQLDILFPLWVSSPNGFTGKSDGNDANPSLPTTRVHARLGGRSSKSIALKPGKDIGAPDMLRGGKGSSRRNGRKGKGKGYTPPKVNIALD